MKLNWVLASQLRDSFDINYKSVLLNFREGDRICYGICKKHLTNKINKINKEHVCEIDDDKDIFLGYKKNQAVGNTAYDYIIFSDDDTIFPPNFRTKLENFLLNKPPIYHTRILLPSGYRFWDHARLNPHQNTNYDIDRKNDWYVSGNLIIIRQDIYNKCQWDNDIVVGLYYDGEDVDYSNRLKPYVKNIENCFDIINYVWHMDYKYTSDDYTISRQTNYNKCDWFYIDLKEINNV